MEQDFFQRWNRIVMMAILFWLAHIVGNVKVTRRGQVIFRNVNWLTVVIQRYQILLEWCFFQHNRRIICELSRLWHAGWTRKSLFKRLAVFLFVLIVILLTVVFQIFHFCVLPILMTLPSDQCQCSSCVEGYMLLGNPSRTCLPNGKWSGGIPVCVGIYLVLIT